MHTHHTRKSFSDLMSSHIARPGLKQFGYFAFILFAAFAAALAITTL
jgi:hypothetical protein